MTKMSSVLGVGLLASRGAFAQPKGQSIEGVWQAVEVTPASDGRTIQAPNRGPTCIIFTGKHYSRVEVHSAGPPTTWTVTRGR
jgi:hypothetical protein